jgi:hypothetical protein
MVACQLHQLLFAEQRGLVHSAPLVCVPPPLLQGLSNKHGRTPLDGRNVLVSGVLGLWGQLSVLVPDGIALEARRADTPNKPEASILHGVDLQSRKALSEAMACLRNQQQVRNGGHLLPVECWLLSVAKPMWIWQCHCARDLHVDLCVPTLAEPQYNSALPEPRAEAHVRQMPQAAHQSGAKRS